MITLFSVPKPFRDHIAIVQRNAIRSWTLLSPVCEILLLGDDEGVAEIAAELGVRHLPVVDRNEYSTPLVNDAFGKAENQATNNLLCYVNADIVLMNDFVQAVTRVARQMRRFLMVGRRWNVDIEQSLDFSGDWENSLRLYVSQKGILYSISAIDYFVFPRGTFHEIPPFAIGRTIWDNWFLYNIRSRGIPLVDATKVVAAVHQNHDYAHASGGEKGVWEGPEAQRNLELAGRVSQGFSIRDCTHALTSDDIKRTLDWWHIERHLGTSSIFHPYLRLPVAVILRSIALMRTVRSRVGSV